MVLMLKESPMKKFIVRALAVIGFLTVAYVASLITIGIFAARENAKAPDSMVLAMDFTAPVVEREDTSPVDFAIDDEAVALTDTLRAIGLAKNDPRVKAMVGTFGAAQPSMSHAQEIRAAIKEFRESKKPTYAFGTSYGQFGGAGKAYFLASAFENLWLQPVGSVSLNGPAIQSPFFREALDKLGAKADFMQREEYKSFMDMATRNAFAPPVRANMESLLEDLSAQMASGLSESRNLDADHVRKLMEHGPYTDQEALQAGLVSRLGYEDELEKSLRESFGKDVKLVDPKTYLGYKRHAYGTRKEESKQKPTRVALIQGAGAIVEHASEGDSLTGDRILGADSIVEAFDEVVKNEDIKAALFRIDSPGGSPEASEMIRRAVTRAQAAGKPVIVSMGSVAASGGYWAAMNADAIVANPATLTGSIGVVTGKFVIGPALEKGGVRLETITSPQSASAPSYETMWSVESEFTPAQRARVTAMIDRTYNAFLENVASARKIPLDKMPSLAKGRVFTGAQAQKLGLVDKLGGYKVALASVREKLKLKPSAPLEFVLLPKPHNPIKKFIRMIFATEEGAARLSTAMAALTAIPANPLSSLWREAVRSARSQGAVETRLPFAETLTP